MVNINLGGKVKVARGHAEAKLMLARWTSFLVKVENQSEGAADRIQILYLLNWVNPSEKRSAEWCVKAWQ